MDKETYTSTDSTDEKLDLEEEQGVNALEEIEAYFVNDPLYRYIQEKSFTHGVITEDLLALSKESRYSSEEVAKFMEYEYFYNPLSGKYLINSARIRYWLSSKDEQNFIGYLGVKKVGNSWMFDVYTIIKIKILSILRYVYEKTQKEINDMANGLLPNDYRRSPLGDDVYDGDFDTTDLDLYNSDELPQMIPASLVMEVVDHLKNQIEEQQLRINELTQEQTLFLESYKNELNDFKNEIAENVSNEVDKMRQQTKEMSEQLSVYRLQAEAEEAWENRGKMKNLFASSDSKKQFIQEYIRNKRITD
ncbi:hypothetical protein L2089_15540 [Paenibacillus hunanensis]|uniref:hypothetical protein n=1 Tax=Paenibacillus hunanensis TaxID=539262 RepID=UPI002026A692|nr:hypothetical protein [Paenibacillus hunanensis]MCL9662107.1 hypothetical protein [Paenibacillus hunanensis]